MISLFYNLFKRNRQNQGYSILELSVVLAILATLSSIAIPTVIDSLKLSRTEEAKSLLNSYIADCLAKYRFDKDKFEDEKPSEFSVGKISSMGYKVKENKPSCTSITIQPSMKGEKILYEMGFAIDKNSGKVRKNAIPADDPKARSFNSCKGWAGEGCGASEELKKRWAMEAELARLEKVCNEQNASFLQGGKTGISYTWDSSKKSCSRKTFVCEGKPANDAKACKAKIDLAICQKWIDNHKLLKTTDSKPFKKKECGESTEFYFYEGENLGTSSAIQAKYNDEKIQKCINRNTDRAKRGWKGIFWGIEGPSPCGDPVWICENKIYTQKNNYLLTKCGQKEVAAAEETRKSRASNRPPDSNYDPNNEYEKQDKTAVCPYKQPPKCKNASWARKRLLCTCFK